MNLIERINQKMGFTKNELRVVLFLIFAFLVGSGIKIYKTSFMTNDKSLDYSESDRVFQQLSQSNYAPSVDTITEVNSREKVNKKTDLKQHSIRINTASKNELMKIPGIGEVTAERIILFREESGVFKNEMDLLRVKGIGKKKLELIKQYLTFD
jgi:competence protein ComEA